MTRIISVRFRDAGKVYYFATGDLVVHKGAHVIVETSRGVEYGVVASEPMDMPDEKLAKPVKPILRIANERDEEQAASNRQKEKEAYRVCQEKIREHNLDMKLINAEYTFDNNKVLFYFTADGRIDFRALVKDLAAVFKTRIELRQIGVRDETRLLGGMGICGRPLCCHAYLTDFVPVSIKMAKEQGLSLNPTKISGVCGRLMCCLKNEEDVYEEINKKLPRVGDIVATEDGLEGEVVDTNVLRETVRILVEDGDTKEMHDVPADTTHFLRKKPKHQNQPKNANQDNDKAEGEGKNNKAEKDNGAKGGKGKNGRGDEKAADNKKARDNQNRNGKNRRNGADAQGDDAQAQRVENGKGQKNKSDNNRNNRDGGRNGEGRENNRGGESNGSGNRDGAVNAENHEGERSGEGRSSRRNRNRRRGHGGNKPQGEGGENKA